MDSWFHRCQSFVVERPWRNKAVSILVARKQSKETVQVAKTHLLIYFFQEGPPPKPKTFQNLPK